MAYHGLSLPWSAHIARKFASLTDALAGWFGRGAPAEEASDNLSEWIHSEADVVLRLPCVRECVSSIFCLSWWKAQETTVDGASQVQTGC